MSNDEFERAKYALRKKFKIDNLDSDDIKMIKDCFTSEELIEMLMGTNNSHLTLVRWLYDSYPEVLREYEQKLGMTIQFVGRNFTEKD